MINVNFRHDWREFLEKDLATYDLEYDSAKSLEENTVRYSNAKRRTARDIGRTIHESKELAIPKQHSGDYFLLKRLMCEGGDLKPYLSRDIQRKVADKNDALLNEWGIQHLHFQSGGTCDVLFVKITDTDIFIIQSLPHGRGHSDVWVNRLLLQILHDNWPETAVGKVVGLQGEALTATERATLRRKNVNVATTMLDDTVYLAPGGGLTASGHCFSDICNSDKIFENLAYWQKLVEANETNFRAALNIFPPEELSIKMMFEKDECWLYEPTKKAKLSLTLRQ